jgi:hypothetical protein
MKSLHLFGLIALAAAALHGQPTNGPVYWTTAQPDCTGVDGPVAITNSTGATIGYSCYVSGTFVWLAAGGMWGTSIRVAAPASAAIGVDYTFYDTSGNNLSLDTTFGSGSSISSGNEVDFALSANQPAEVALLGATSYAPSYSNNQAGSVYAVFYCPDATTCSDALPQMLYSALPDVPWSLSVPIAWDSAIWTQWSAEGVDDGSVNVISFVVYNEGTTATSFAVRVYDSTGALAGTGTTPSIPPFQPLVGGGYGEAGTYGILLSQVITPLPSGLFKVVFDGGSEYSAVEVLQIHGASATALQVAYDSAPGSSAARAAVRRPKVRSARVASTPKPVFSAMPR